MQTSEEARHDVVVAVGIKKEITIYLAYKYRVKRSAEFQFNGWLA